MHRPVAGPFDGSMPADDLAAPGLARLLELAFGGLAMAGALAVWGAAYWQAGEPDIRNVLVASCLATLAPAALGLWVVGQVQAAPQTTTMRVYDAVFRRLAQGDRLAIRHAPAEGSTRGLAGLIGDLALLIRRLHAGRVKTVQAAGRANQSLEAGRHQAEAVARRIRDTAASLAATAAAVGTSATRLSGEIAATSQALEMTDSSVSRVIDGAATLAGSVRATTANAERMTSVAVRLSQVAHDTQKCVADLDDRSASLEVALEPIGRALQAAGALARSSTLRAAEPGATSRHLAQVATDIKEMAGTCQNSLETALSTIGQILRETAEANRRIAEISDLVRVNHEVSFAVSHAVHQQSEEIAHILTGMYEARSGFATLRAGVDAVTRASASRKGGAEAVRDEAARLPGHADDLARILRDLPDFAPPEY